MSADMDVPCKCGHDRYFHSGHLRNGDCQIFVETDYCECQGFEPAPLPVREPSRPTTPRSRP